MVLRVARRFSLRGPSIYHKPRFRRAAGTTLTPTFPVSPAHGTAQCCQHGGVRAGKLLLWSQDSQQNGSAPLTLYDTMQYLLQKRFRDNV